MFDDSFTTGSVVLEMCFWTSMGFLEHLVSWYIYSNFKSIVHYSLEKPQFYENIYEKSVKGEFFYFLLNVLTENPRII